MLNEGFDSPIPIYLELKLVVLVFSCDLRVSGTSQDKHLYRWCATCQRHAHITHDSHDFTQLEGSCLLDVMNISA